MKRAFNKLYSSLVFGLCMVAVCWIGSAYVVVVSSLADIESKQTSQNAASESTSIASVDAVEISIDRQVTDFELGA